MLLKVVAATCECAELASLASIDLDLCVVPKGDGERERLHPVKLLPL